MKTTIVPQVAAILLTAAIAAPAAAANPLSRFLGGAEEEPAPRTTEATVEPAAEDAGTDEVTWDTLADEQEIIVQHYVGASVMIGNAQVEMAEALELQEQAELIRAEADALAADSAMDEERMESYARVSKRTNTLIQKKLEESDELTDEQRQQFVGGLVLYAEGIQQTQGLVDEAQPFADSVRRKATDSAQEVKQSVDDPDIRQPANLLRRLPGFGRRNAESDLTSKFATGLYIAKHAPGLFRSHGTTLGQIVDYMHSKGIEVPAEPTAALSDFEDSDQSGGFRKSVQGLLGGSSS